MAQPSFDTWTSIFLFASVQGLFVSVILFFIKKENRYANRLIAAIVFLFSITLFEYVLFWTRYIIDIPNFANISAGFPFLFGPILYFYFRYIAESKKITVSDGWHLIPFAAFTIYMSPFYFLSSPDKIKILSGESSYFFTLNFWRYFIIWSRTGLLVAYCLWIHFSFHDKIAFSKEISDWYRYVMIFFALFVLSYGGYFVLIHFAFFNSAWDYGISFAMSFFIFFMAWFGYLQPQVFNGFSVREILRPAAKYKTSNLSESASKTLIHSAEKLMEESHAFEESELNLEKLAGMLGVTKHNLSQAINENTGLNFFEFVNGFRIREAQKMLAETSKQQYNIIEIAYRVGFNNKVSFNNTFKKITGVTPTEFRKRNREVKEAEKQLSQQ
jgi:AraC-like DNA-binding protein